MNCLFDPSQFNLRLNLRAQSSAPLIEDAKFAKRFQVLYPDQIVKFTPLTETAKKIAGLKLYTTIFLTLGLAFLSPSFRLSFELYQKNLKIIPINPLTSFPASWPEEAISPIADEDGHLNISVKTPSASSSFTQESPVADSLDEGLRPSIGLFSSPEIAKPQLKIQLPPNDSRLTPSPAHFEIDARPKKFGVPRRDTPRPTPGPFLLNHEEIMKAIAALAAERSEDPEVGSPEIAPDLRQFSDARLALDLAKPRSLSCPSVGIAQMLEPIELKGTVSLPESRTASFFLTSFYKLPTDVKSFSLDDPQIPSELKQLCQTAFAFKSKLHLFEPLELMQLKRFWSSGTLQSFIDEDFVFNTIKMNSQDIQRLVEQPVSAIDKEVLEIVGMFMTSKQKTHQRPLGQLLIRLNTLLLLTTQACIKLEDLHFQELQDFEKKFVKQLRAGEFSSHNTDRLLSEGLSDLGATLIKWLQKIQLDESYLLKEVFLDVLDLCIKLKNDKQDILNLDFSLSQEIELFQNKWFSK